MWTRRDFGRRQLLRLLLTSSSARSMKLKLRFEKSGLALRQINSSAESVGVTQLALIPELPRAVGMRFGPPQRGIRAYG